MKVYPDLMFVMRRGRAFISPKSKQHPVLELIIAALSVLIMAVLFSSCGAKESFAAEVGIISKQDVKTAADILYAEAASDPKGWNPKLNTYFRSKRKAETTLAAMKRVSSAYRKQSKQYKKASTGDLNAFERKIYNRITEMVRSFRPDPNWECLHHENLDLYSNRAAAIAHLRKSWGDCVDFDNAVKIGQEHYFKLVKSQNGRSTQKNGV